MDLKKKKTRFLYQTATAGHLYTPSPNTITLIYMSTSHSR